MVSRTFWSNLLGSAWEQKTVVWLTGVRGAGKTSLCQTLWDAEFFDCEAPRVRRLMADPEEFWKKLRGKKVVLDEIHRLPNLLPLLKTVADRFPSSRVLVTSPVSLQVNPYDRAALEEGLAQVWLTPMMSRINRELGIITMTFLWRARDFTPRGLQAFRNHYPSGPNWVVCRDATRASVHSLPRLKVEFISLKEMIEKISAGGNGVTRKWAQALVHCPAIPRSRTFPLNPSTIAQQPCRHSAFRIPHPAVP